jgi:hypothetical protein
MHNITPHNNQTVVDEYREELPQYVCRHRQTSTVTYLSSFQSDVGWREKGKEQGQYK